MSSFLFGSSFCFGFVVSSLLELPPGGVQKAELEANFVKNEAWSGGRPDTISLKEWVLGC